MVSIARVRVSPPSKLDAPPRGTGTLRASLMHRTQQRIHRGEPLTAQRRNRENRQGNQDEQTD